MSIKKGILVSILFLAIGLSAYIFLPLRTSILQTPNSPNFLQSKFSSKGVVNRIIQLKLKFTGAKLNSEKVKVTAEVGMPFDFSEKLYFKWKLGPDVILVEGEQSGTIDGVLKNEVKKVTFTVTGFSKENNHQIGFEIYGIKNGKNVYGDTLIASDLENTFENIVQNVEKIKASQ